jgi:hypothetical protein
MQPSCHLKAINITYSECVFVALGVRLECACALLSSVAFFAILKKKKKTFTVFI